jgi:hypothetical protein
MLKIGHLNGTKPAEKGVAPLHVAQLKVKKLA